MTRTEVTALARTLQEGAEAIRDLGGDDFADACETAAAILKGHIAIEDSHE